MSSACGRWSHLYTAHLHTVRSGHWNFGLTATTCVLGSSLAVPLRFYNYYTIGATLCQPLFYNFLGFTLPSPLIFTPTGFGPHLLLAQESDRARRKSLSVSVLYGQLATSPLE